MSFEKIGLLCSRSRSQWSFKMSVNVCLDIFWTTIFFFFFFTKRGIVMQHYEPECHAGGKKSLLSSRSRSQRGLISKYDSFYYICWTIDSSATKHDLMKHNCKPECLLKIIGLLHWRSESQWRVKMSVFLQMISSKPPNSWLPNAVSWCIIISESIMQKERFAIFKVKVTAVAHMIKLWQWVLYLMNCWSFCYLTWFYNISW